MVRKKTTTPVVAWSVEEYRQTAAFFTVLREIHQNVAANRPSSSKSKKTPKKLKSRHIRARSPAGSFYIIQKIYRYTYL